MMARIEMEKRVECNKKLRRQMTEGFELEPIALMKEAQRGRRPRKMEWQFIKTAKKMVYGRYTFRKR